MALRLVFTFDGAIHSEYLAELSIKAKMKTVISRAKVPRRR
jgi:hypothetical protein